MTMDLADAKVKLMYKIEETQEEIEFLMEKLGECNKALHPTLVGNKNPTRLQKAADKAWRAMFLEETDEERQHYKFMRDSYMLEIEVLNNKCSEAKNLLVSWDKTVRELREMLDVSVNDVLFDVNQEGEVLATLCW